MAIQTRIDENTYRRIVLTDPDRQWELHNGQLREKPGMTWEHNRAVVELGYLLRHQLDPHQFQVFIEGRVRRSPDNIFIPDVFVLPTAYGGVFRGRPGVLAIISEPLPLVAEVWSTSTGDYDVEAKLPVYKQRGDLEIWFIHPYERTLRTWRRQPDGSYDESVYREGIVSPIALPDVAIDLAALFDA